MQGATESGRNIENNKRSDFKETADNGWCLISIFEDCIWQESKFPQVRSPTEETINIGFYGYIETFQHWKYAT